MKIAVVGGGSTYTPELVDGFARLFPQADLCLVDPVADRLEVIGGLSSRIFGDYGASGRVTWTSDLDAGLTDASVVILQLRVGGQQARISDETLPMSCGCVGQETTGFGGLAKAMRTVPVVLDIAERAARLAAPGAWIVDFTNPVGIVTRALLDAGHRAVGLCNVAIGLERWIAGMLDVKPSSVLLGHVGLNHLTWERAVYVDGVDRLPELLETRPEELAAEVGLPPRTLLSTRSLPSYYLRYFYCHDEVVREDTGRPTRGEQVAAIESELLRMYADPTLSKKPKLLEERGGAYYSEAAVGLLSSLLNPSAAGPHAVNVRNNGTLPFLSDDAVIEVTCDVDTNGARPRPVAPVEPSMSGLIASVSAYEELALDAAIRGGRERVYAALLAHPLIGQHQAAEELTDKLIAANAEHLAWAR
ncbi:6-phospho-beta-glucosidase [Streptomyces sp. AP-93]|uniref:6-phospho-beta-glucosidase n=1 Tax=Streptomyces sp. AP-93 TaxID=2929048 RepID=UPI001FAF250A|nr:6-phospho-beta-glucosidase [Streptomyces sp. AP-93]MCJ0874926.1 6-phospho-beta-glucosidase [Streptomyces sp. AP-93]